MQTLDPEEQRVASALARLAVFSLVLGVLAVLLSPLLVGGLLGLVGLAVGVTQMTQGRLRRALAVWGSLLSLLGVAGSVGAGVAYHRLHRAGLARTQEA